MWKHALGVIYGKIPLTTPDRGNIRDPSAYVHEQEYLSKIGLRQVSFPLSTDYDDYYKVSDS